MTAYEKNKKAYMKYYAKTEHYSFRLRKDNEQELALINLINDAREEGLSVKDLLLKLL